MRGGLEGETSETAVSQNPEITEAATTKTSQATKPGTPATGEGAGCTPNCSRPRGGKPPPQCPRGIPPAAQSPHPVLGSCYPPPWYPLPNHSLYSHHPALLPVLIHQPFYFHLKIKSRYEEFMAGNCVPCLSPLPVFLELCPWVFHLFLELRDWEAMEGGGENWGEVWAEVGRAEETETETGEAETGRPRERCGEGVGGRGLCKRTC